MFFAKFSPAREVQTRLTNMDIPDKAATPTTASPGIQRRSRKNPYPFPPKTLSMLKRKI